MKSWKRTTSAILGIVTLVTTSLTAMLDDNAATVPQWEIVIPAVMTQVGLLISHFTKSTASGDTKTEEPK